MLNAKHLPRTDCAFTARSALHAFPVVALGGRRTTTAPQGADFLFLALCCNALGLLASPDGLSSTAASIGPSRWFLMLRPHCVPPLPEPETARRALLLHGAVIAFTLAATTAQRRLNEHKFCSAFYLCNHASAGTFTAADSAAFHAGAGHFSEQEKAGRRLRRSPGFKSRSPREASLELDYLSLFSAQHKQTQSAP